jgi:hypothetical protein
MIRIRQGRPFLSALFRQIPVKHLSHDFRRLTGNIQAFYVLLAAVEAFGLVFVFPVDPDDIAAEDMPAQYRQNVSYH